MGRRISAAATVTVVTAAVLALLLASVPALAHHKDGHLQGGGNGGAASPAEEDGGDADEGDNAHPSGKDRSEENGNSGSQGNSESDPDDDGNGPDRSNGGPDKPNGSGGVDQADQDGNNGCGNDDDFEDDNEGWCGSKPKPARPAAAAAAPCDADAAMPGVQPCKDDEVDVLGDVIPRPDAGDVELPAIPEEAEGNGNSAPGGPHVLGERLAQAQPVEGGPAQRGASFLGQALPFTGSAVTTLAAIAVGLLLAGAGLLATRKRA